jgi:hypothetical protein
LNSFLIFIVLITITALKNVEIESFASFSDALRSSRAATPRRTLVLVRPSARDGEEETWFAGYAERLRADCAWLPAVSPLTAASRRAGERFPLQKEG